MVAKVPYQPYPDQAPSQEGTPLLRMNVPGEAFGTTVGAALSHLGGVEESSANELFDRAKAMQQLQNESEARDADAQYMIGVGKLHADFSALQGKAAVDAFPKYMADVQSLRMQQRQGLSNDMARSLYDSSSLSTMGRTIFNGAGHAATQNKVWAGNSSDSRIDALNDQALHNPEQDLRPALQDIENEVRGTQADVHGWDDDQTTREVAKAQSRLVASRIIGLSRTQPIEAGKQLDDFRGQLYGPDLERVEKVVQSQRELTGSRVIADKQSQPDPDTGERKPLQQQVDEGVAEAKAIAPDDQRFQDMTKQRIIANDNERKRIERDAEWTNRNTIASAIVGDYNGQRPTTPEELMAVDPKVAQAWNDLPPVQRNSFLKALAGNAKGDQAWTRQGLLRWQELGGMAQHDPEGFLGVSVVDEQGIPNAQKRQLIDRQQKMMNTVESDPRIPRALQALRGMTGPAGLLDPTNKEQYWRFTGALEDALNQFQGETKKVPTNADIREIGARLLQEQVNPNSWFGNTSKLYSIEPPEEEADKIRADIVAAGKTPTPEIIQRIYTQALYQRLYKGSAKGKGKDTSRAPGVQQPATEVDNGE